MDSMTLIAAHNTSTFIKKYSMNQTDKGNQLHTNMQPKQRKQT